MAVPAQTPAAGPRRPLGQLMVERGLLTEVQLAQALDAQQASGRPLGDVIVRLGFVTAPVVAQALATQHGGLLKTEYGFATGFDSRLPVSSTAAEPPVSPSYVEASRSEPRRPSTAPPDDGGPNPELDALAEKLAQASHQIVSLQTELLALRQSHAALTAERDALDEQLGVRTQEIEQLRAEYESLRQILSELGAARRR